MIRFFLILAMLCGGVASAQEKLSIAMTTWVGYGPLFLARDEGFFKAEGLDVDLKLVEDGAIYFAAMAAKRLDGASATLAGAMKYRADSVCFKAVWVLDDSFGGDGVVTTLDITDLNQLRGKRVGLNEGSASDFWFNLLVERAGLPADAFKVTNLTANDAAAAFIAGRLDAAVTWEPNLTKIAEMKKGKVLIDSKSTPGAISDVVLIRCDVIQDRPKAITALVRGLQKANEEIKSNPDKASAVMAKSVGGSLTTVEAFADAAKSVRFLDRNDSAAFFAGGREGPAGRMIDAGNRIWGRLGGLKKNWRYEDLIDPSFVAAP